MEPLTKFSLQSPLNCSNFCDMSSWALPTALRIVPNTTETKRNMLNCQPAGMNEWRNKRNIQSLKKKKKDMLTLQKTM